MTPEKETSDNELLCPECKCWSDEAIWREVGLNGAEGEDYSGIMCPKCRACFDKNFIHVER